MIAEDAANFQKQLIHLFRVFEVNAAVTAGLVALHKDSDDRPLPVDDDSEDWGVTVLSTDIQLKATYAGPDALKRPRKKKGVLDG